MKTLLEKLYFKPGMRAFTDGEAAQEFSELLSIPTEANEKVDFILLLAENSKILNNQIPKIKELLKPDTLFWVAYPKKTSLIVSDLQTDEGWKPIKTLGYRPVSQIALNNIWTALRIKPGEWPNVSVKKNRKELVLPQEMKNFLEQAGLLGDFQNLSDSHRREYIYAYEEAKKPETRQRRLSYIAEKLLSIKRQKLKHEQ